MADVCVEPLGTQVRREGLSSFADSLRCELKYILSALNESRRAPSESLPRMPHMLSYSLDLVLQKRTVAMNEPTMPNMDVAEADLLVERNAEILDQVRKGLSQEYLRIMSRALYMGRKHAAEDAAAESSTNKAQ